LRNKDACGQNASDIFSNVRSFLGIIILLRETKMDLDKMHLIALPIIDHFEELSFYF
jgi:hypothetical protein